MKILIAEDDPIVRCLLEEAVKDWGYEAVSVSNGAEAHRVLQAPDGPQLALLDWMMPELDGHQVCREVRSQPRDSYIYVILLTAKVHTDEIAAGFEAGADDYLRKPCEPLELRARLLAGQRIVKLHQELILAREAMRHQATHDALTGVWNRRAILESLERELERGRREKRPVSAIMADLDHFKRVNDTLGHQAGDAVLQEAVHRLAADVRPYDLLGRYGGEEFVVVLPGADANNAVLFAERLRRRIAVEPVVHEDAKIEMTMSLGVATCDGVAHCDAAELLHAADTALYEAKRAGRNRVAVSTTVVTRKDTRAHRLVDSKSIR